MKKFNTPKYLHYFKYTKYDFYSLSSLGNGKPAKGEYYPIIENIPKSDLKIKHIKKFDYHANDFTIILEYPIFNGNHIEVPLSVNGTKYLLETQTISKLKLVGEFVLTKGGFRHYSIVNVNDPEYIEYQKQTKRQIILKEKLKPGDIVLLKLKFLNRKYIYCGPRSVQYVDKYFWDEENHRVKKVPHYGKSYEMKAGVRHLFYNVTTNKPEFFGKFTIDDIVGETEIPEISFEKNEKGYVCDLGPVFIALNVSNTDIVKFRQALKLMDL